MSKKMPKFHCKSEAQKKAIRKNYAVKAKQKPPCNDRTVKAQTPDKVKKEFPKDFPFWARFKPNKNRTTLVIDEEQVKRKNSDMIDDCFVHREAIHCDDNNKYVLSGDYEKVYPNPDTSDNSPTAVRFYGVQCRYIGIESVYNSFRVDPGCREIPVPCCF